MHGRPIGGSHDIQFDDRPARKGRPDAEDTCIRTDTRRLKTLMGGTSGSGAASSEVMRLVARLIIEDALEGEAPDALGRGSYARR